jgi:outer membrane protein assembly factor BamD
MLNFKKGPDVSQAATVGEPTLVDPKQTSAPEIVRSATASMMQALNAATNTNAATAKSTPPAPDNGNAPSGDASGNSATTTATGSSGGTNLGSGVEVLNQPSGGAVATTPTPTLAPAPAAPAKDDNAIPEMGNDLAKPASASTDATAPPLPPTQVNDAQKTAPTDSAAPSANSSNAPSTAADPNTESSSKKKKKKHLLVF